MAREGQIHSLRDPSDTLPSTDEVLGIFINVDGEISVRSPNSIPLAAWFVGVRTLLLMIAQSYQYRMGEDSVTFSLPLP